MKQQQSDERIRRLIKATDTVPPGFDKNLAWQEIEARLPPLVNRRVPIRIAGVALAACLAVIALISIYNTPRPAAGVAPLATRKTLPVQIQVPPVKQPAKQVSIPASKLTRQSNLAAKMKRRRSMHFRPVLPSFKEYGLAGNNEAMRPCYSAGNVYEQPGYPVN